MPGQGSVNAHDRTAVDVRGSAGTALRRGGSVRNPSISRPSDAVHDSTSARPTVDARTSVPVVAVDDDRRSARRSATTTSSGRPAPRELHRDDEAVADAARADGKKPPPASLGRPSLLRGPGRGVDLERRRSPGRGRRSRTGARRPARIRTRRRRRACRRGDARRSRGRSGGGRRPRRSGRCRRPRPRPRPSPVGRARHPSELHVALERASDRSRSRGRSARPARRVPGALARLLGRRSRRCGRPRTRPPPRRSGSARHAGRSSPDATSSDQSRRRVRRRRRRTRPRGSRRGRSSAAADRARADRVGLLGLASGDHDQEAVPSGDHAWCSATPVHARERPRLADRVRRRARRAGGRPPPPGPTGTSASGRRATSEAGRRRADRS